MEGESIAGRDWKAFFSTKSESQPPAGHRYALGLVSEQTCCAERQQKGAEQKYLNSLNWA